MELIFKPYLDNFYTAISGFWCMTQKDVKEKLLKGLSDNTLETSLPGILPIKVDMYELANRLPTAPFHIRCRGNNYIIIQARILIVACYESLKDILEEDKKWSKIQQVPLMNIFRHVRNAATHDNHFNIRGVKDLRELPLTWRGKIINSNTIGKELFFEWFSLGDIEYFLEDISKEIRNKLRNG